MQKKFGEKVGKLAGIIGNKTVELGNIAGEKAVGLAKTSGEKATEVVVKAKDGVLKTKDIAMNSMDINGDGKVDLEDIIILGLRTPGVRINREDFLRKEFSKNYPEDVINCIVATNPAKAGIELEEVDKVANEVIKYERNCVSGISTALGMPGGAAMVATIPADIIQYYGYMLRAIQKLLYLYGFPEINTDEKGQMFDSETLNILTICMGVMYGAAGANNAIKGVARALAVGVERQLIKKALTKGTIYPIVKSVSKWFGVKMTKEVFAGFFKKAIPVVGGVIGGGLTFITFKPCCDKLKESLRVTQLANPSLNTDEDYITDMIAKDIADEEGLEEEVLSSVLKDEDLRE